MKDIAGLLKEKRADILTILQKYGALNARIFGSVARGEVDENSDLDILVELKPGVTLLQHAAMVSELEGLLGCKVDIVSEKGLMPRVRSRVLKEAVPI
jgi:uncharacterized protein